MLGDSRNEWEGASAMMSWVTISRDAGCLGVLHNISLCCHVVNAWHCMSLGGCCILVEAIEHETSDERDVRQTATRAIN